MAITSAKDIKELGKAIDHLIDSLPGINSTANDQLQELERLRLQDDQYNLELKETIEEAGTNFNRVVPRKVEHGQNANY